MALKKNVKDLSEENLCKPVFSKDMLFRIKDIMEQTGLTPPELFLKWVLQEETLIGLIQSGKNRTTRQPKTVAEKTVTAQKKGTEDVAFDSKNPGYRKELVKKAGDLKKKGMTHKKIAETFNDEKVPTVSGTGKWYSSSINNLLSKR